MSRRTGGLRVVGPTVALPARRVGSAWPALRALAAAAALWWPLPGVAAGPVVTVIDVGYGTAVHLDLGGAVLLIDAGPAEATGQVIRRVRERGGGQPDLLVLSHLHPDHAGGAPALIDALRPAAVRVGVGPAPGLPPGVSVTVIPGLPAGDDNDRSASVLVDTGGFRALIPSDAGPALQRVLAESAAIRAGPIDLLVWPHHGGTIDPAFEGALGRVGTCVVSTGPNPYGLPVAELDAVAARLCGRLLRTDRDGDIVLAPGADR